MPQERFMINGCWQPDPSGEKEINIIIGRGEGSNGVITVEIQEPVSQPPDPVDLAVSDISALDLTVYTGPTTSTTYGMADLATTSFLFLLSKVWPNGITANYRIRVK